MPPPTYRIFAMNNARTHPGSDGATFWPRTRNPQDCPASRRLDSEGLSFARRDPGRRSERRMGWRPKILRTCDEPLESVLSNSFPGPESFGCPLRRTEKSAVGCFTGYRPSRLHFKPDRSRMLLNIRNLRPNREARHFTFQATPAARGT